MVKFRGFHSETLRGSRILLVNFEGSPSPWIQDPKVLYPEVLVPLLHHILFKCSISFSAGTQRCGNVGFWLPFGRDVGQRRSNVVTMLSL